MYEVQVVTCGKITSAKYIGDWVCISCCFVGKRSCGQFLESISSLPSIILMGIEKIRETRNGENTVRLYYKITDCVLSALYCSGHPVSKVLN